MKRHCFALGLVVFLCTAPSPAQEILLTGPWKAAPVGRKLWREGRVELAAALGLRASHAENQYRYSSVNCGIIRGNAWHSACGGPPHPCSTTAAPARRRRPQFLGAGFLDVARLPSARGQRRRPRSWHFDQLVANRETLERRVNGSIMLPNVESLVHQTSSTSS